MEREKAKQLRAIVKDSYETAAVHFAATRTKAPGADFFWAVDQVKGEGLVLDAGCGSGRLLAWKKLATDKYLGIDQSNGLIGLAQQAYPDHAFRVVDLANTEPFAHDQFATVFCSAVLGHIPGKDSRQQALQNLYLSAKTGGRLIISFWKFRGKYRRQLYQTWWNKIIGRHRYGWFDLVFPWKDDDGKEIAFRYYHLFSKRSFRQEIEASGWKIVEDNDSSYNYWIIAEK